METVCKICGCALLDDDNVARDNFGVNLECHADCITALTPSPSAHVAGLREAAQECQRLAESYTRSLSHYDEDHPERAKIKWGAAAVTVAAENILARAAEREGERE